MACPTDRRVGICGETTVSLCPMPRSKTGWRLGEKKAQVRMDTDFLDWALADVSGYVAADELYDGPFCSLSAVDNRCYQRILYEVLDHAPDQDDIRAFLSRLKTALDTRDLKLLGITTDGSSLYPEPLAEVFSGVPHQLCQFHVIKEITKEVLKAVANVMSEGVQLCRECSVARFGQPHAGRLGAGTANTCSQTQEWLPCKGELGKILR